MKYQNTITGAIIEINSEITEGPWQALSPAITSEKEEVAPVQQKKRKAVKKDE